MVGASIETTLELWASSLRDVKARIRPLFSQERVAVSAGKFLDGLLGNEPRKTGWMRAEAAGNSGPWRQQAILGRGRWDADALRDIVRECALETLADETAVLVIDETGFLKQGKASCGVARQYTGSAGKITNCQIGVFASYVSRHGHPSSRQRRAAQKNTVTSSEKPLLLICWSIQEIRRIAIKLAQRRIQPAHVIAWSLWRRAHQVEARHAHLKRKTQL